MLNLIHLQKNPKKPIITTTKKPRTFTLVRINKENKYRDGFRLTNQ